MDIDPRLRSDTSSGSQYPPLHRTSGSAAPPVLAPNPSPPSNTHQYQGGQNGPHQIGYSPHTPYSLTNSSTADRPSSAHDGSPEEGGTNDPKRPRACEACRGLKVRCEFDVNNTSGACKRCAKANRSCVVTVPSRKRQKKTDSRVAELEKKIDALTASLQATKSSTLSIGQGSEHEGDHQSPSVATRPNQYEQVTNGSFGAPFEARKTSDSWPAPERYRKTSDSSSKPPQPPMVIAGQKRKYPETSEFSILSVTPTSMASSRSESNSRAPTTIHQLGYGEFADEAPAQKSSSTNLYADVIDRGVINMEKATKMFNRYTNEMALHLPAVVFPPGTMAADIRKSKPTLFLAVLCAGSGTDHPEIQRVLTKEVMQIYGDRIICHGEKTLELVQALLVSTIWYWPPEHFEELKFYQLIHTAAVMAIDININKRSKGQRSKMGNPGLWRDHAWRRTPFPDSESLEARRAWLGCYFMCSATSMGLRRPNLIGWTTYMAECIEVLESSPEATVVDRYFCQLVRNQHIAEEIGTQFSMDDPFAIVNIADAKVQYALRGFERDLEHWSRNVPVEVRAPTLKMAEHVVNIYLHEVAMHVDHNVEEFKPPFTEEGLRGSGMLEREDAMPLTPSHISALSTCLTSIDGMFEAFFSFEIDIVRTLPILFFVRIAYAVVVLIKMYFAAAKPNSELGKVINKDNMKVENYLDGLLEKFRATAADDKSRPASKFLMVLVMLKTWFHRSKTFKQPSVQMNYPPFGLGPKSETQTPGQTPAPSGSTSIQAPNPPNQQQTEYSEVNTPLQLLSEVATGGTPRPESRNQYPSNDWHQQQPSASLAQQASSFPYANAGAGNSIPPGYGMMYGGQSNIDPALGLPIEFDFNMGDGFEQAMGMTLGDGDLGRYFQDEAFWNVMMDSVGVGSNPFPETI